jgi:hypothetical protein
MAEQTQDECRRASADPERAPAARFRDAGLAVGSMLVVAGYVPSQRNLAQVFERLYWQFIAEGSDRPDLRTSLASIFLDALQAAGFEPPHWMRLPEWMRMILAFDAPPHSQ